MSSDDNGAGEPRELRPRTYRVERLARRGYERAWVHVRDELAKLQTWEVTMAPDARREELARRIVDTLIRADCLCLCQAGEADEAQEDRERRERRALQRELARRK